MNISYQPMMLRECYRAGQGRAMQGTRQKRRGKARQAGGKVRREASNGGQARGRAMGEGKGLLQVWQISLGSMSIQMLCSKYE